MMRIKPITAAVTVGSMMVISSPWVIRTTNPELFDKFARKIQGLPPADHPSQLKTQKEIEQFLKKNPELKDRWINSHGKFTDDNPHWRNGPKSSQDWPGLLPQAMLAHRLQYMYMVITDLDLWEAFKENKNLNINLPHVKRVLEHPAILACSMSSREKVEHLRYMKKIADLGWTEFCRTYQSGSEHNLYDHLLRNPELTDLLYNTQTAPSYSKS